MIKRIQLSALLGGVLILSLLTQSSLAQYHKFAQAHGFAVSPIAAITSIARAGGGVVLKTVARPRSAEFIAPFSDISLHEQNEQSSLYLTTGGWKISYSDSTWIMRDAAMLVNAESEESMYRDVNLFGKFNSTDLANGYTNESHYKVEVTDALKSTKSGQTLLYMDIMLAGNPNTTYYSSNTAAAEKYIETVEAMRRKVNEYNQRILPEIFDAFMDEEKKFMASSNDKKLNAKAKIVQKQLEKYMSKIKFYSGWARQSQHDSLEKYMYLIKLELEIFGVTEFKNTWTDYTYNDEAANYTFYRSGNYLTIEGAPNYTFLYHDISSGKDKLVIDEQFTDFFLKHPKYIKDLNPVVTNNAEHFGRIAAFYRYLKNKYPSLWAQVYQHYLAVKKTNGTTPKYIGRTP